ncbi:protein lifeguard 3-like [Eublepharis macularius]|uniref:Protein lifeguard 3-like n=1 Tax=Eublepharis macularius TaxID=481883 RepID=A0AA97KPI0_EUBMA|nr:protein lifeguard 3-like [Eublepharis macularius]
MSRSPSPPYEDENKKSGTEGNINGVEKEEGIHIVLWGDKNVRHSFIRKVYSIISLQLLVTVGIIAIFTFVQPVSDFVQKNYEIYYASWFVFLFSYLVLACWKSIQRWFPWNIILMTIFTLAMGFMTGSIASVYNTKAVIVAMILSALATITITIFSFQTKVDLTSCNGFSCIVAIVIMLTGLATAIVLFCTYIYWLYVLFADLIVIAFTLLLAYDTQVLLEHKSFAISPEDYVYGAIHVYINIIYIFGGTLQLTGRA